MENERKISVLICWDSVTGNTTWAVEKLSQYLQEFNFNISSANVRENFHPDIVAHDIIIFAYPVFAFKPILTMMDCYEKLPPTGGKPCFLFHTNGGGPVGSSHYFAKKLFFKGYSVLGECSIKMKDSWTILRNDKFDERYPENLLELADQNIYEFASGLKHNFLDFIHSKFDIQPIKRNWSLLNLLRVFYNKKLLGIFFPIRVDLQKCTNCGKCEEACPTGRIKIENFPKTKGLCIGCYGCINVCPENAIDSIFTKNKNRYRGPSVPPSVPPLVPPLVPGSTSKHL